MKKKYYLIVISLLMILIGSVTASLVQTSNGLVEVKDVRVVTDYGRTLSGLLFIPEGVSAENPAPAVITSHGYLNSREMQTNFNVELSRRGFVVFSMDMFGHGYSDTAPSKSNGAHDAIQYVSSLDFVDKANIGLEGHSMGGYSVIMGAVENPTLVKSVIVTGSGINWARHESLTSELPINFGFVFGQYDEFAPLMWGVEKAADAFKTDLMKNFFGTEQDVVANSWYGDLATNTARILYTPSETHPWNHFSNASAAHVVEFFQQTLEGGNSLDPSNQIWLYKEIGTLVAMLGMFLLIFPLGSVLLSVVKFKPTAKLTEAKQTLSPVFWILFVIGTAIPALTYFPLMELGGKLIKTSALFPQSITNQVVIWAVGNGIIALIILFVSQYMINRKNNFTTKEWGYRETFKNILKLCFVAILVVGACYLTLSIVHSLWIVDFRFWVVGIKTMTAQKWTSFAVYLPFFLIFFLINAMSLNVGIRIKGASYKRVATLSAISNTLGIAILIGYDYFIMFTKGMLAAPAQNLTIIVAFPFLVTLSLAAVINTYFYKKTNSIYLGAFISALLITWMCVANTAFQFMF